MADVKFVDVMNTNKNHVPIELHNGHGNSMSIVPSEKPIKIKYEFVSWETPPNAIKIIRYYMQDGSSTTQLPDPQELQPVAAVASAPEPEQA